MAREGLVGEDSFLSEGATEATLWGGEEALFRVTDVITSEFMGPCSFIQRWIRLTEIITIPMKAKPISHRNLVMGLRDFERWALPA